MEHEIKIPTLEEIKKKIREQFKQDYINFIYAPNMVIVIEYTYRTGADLFWMEIYKALDSESIEKIRKFILDNIRTNQKWKN